MKRILLDENIPLKLLELATADCDARHVLRLGWSHLSDADLLDRAGVAGFDVFLTADRSIAYQQNLISKRIALVVLTTNNWPVIREHAFAIFQAAIEVDTGAVSTVALPRPAVQRRR